MLSRWILELETTEGQNPSIQWGPMLHGAFLKLWPSRLVEQLHEQRMHPFAQYIEPLSTGRALWHIHLWGEEFAQAEEILSRVTEIELTNRARVAVKAKRWEAVSATDFWDKAMQIPLEKHFCDIRFKTPTTQKSMGEYLMFPSWPLIFRHLHLRAIEILQGFYCESEDHSKALGEALRIHRYSLESAPFFIQKSPIIGYMGFLRLLLPNAPKLMRDAHVLLELAKYTGIGAKTALGMGGVEVSWKEETRGLILAEFLGRPNIPQKSRR